MNANSLWAGTDYAHFEQRGRGENYRPYAHRVRVIKVFKKKTDYYSERLSTFAEVFMLTDEGEHKLDYDGEPITRTVRARDIASFWEHYESEREVRQREKERIEAERQAELQREELARAELTDRLEAAGIPRLAVKTVTAYDVRLDRKVVEEWLHAALDTSA